MEPRLSAELEMGLQTALADELAGVLLRNSALTRAQLETLLIQSLGSQMIGTAGVDVLRRFRVKRTVSRGSYNRTLLQARVNVRKSMYTLLLLGYLGLLNDVRFEPFLELGSKLQFYVKEARSRGTSDNRLLAKRIKEELELMEARIASKRDL